jgi:hypothetical protein
VPVPTIGAIPLHRNSVETGQRSHHVKRKNCKSVFYSVNCVCKRVQVLDCYARNKYCNFSIVGLRFTLNGGGLSKKFSNDPTHQQRKSWRKKEGDIHIHYSYMEIAHSASATNNKSVIESITGTTNTCTGVRGDREILVLHTGKRTPPARGHRIALQGSHQFWQPPQTAQRL